MEGEVGPLTWEFLLPRLAAVLFLIAANGFFVTLEFALVAARRTRLETLAREGKSVARLVLRMMDQTDLYIAAAQFGVTLASLALGWVGESTVNAIIFPLVTYVVGAAFSPLVSHIISTTLSFALITFLHLVLGEQVPKIITIREPEAVSLLVARPMEVFTFVFRPFIWLLDRTTALVLHLLGFGEVAGHRHAYSLEELKLLVEESEEHGLIEEHEGEILTRVFEFSDRDVREAMIPRTEIIGVPKSATVEELLQIFKHHRHARFPVYEENLDNIVGIVNIKDVLALLADNPQVRNKRLEDLDIIRPAYAVPETKPIGELFQELREQQIQMAIVIDEYGGTAGLVTTEELAEEILGRITDEWVIEEPDIKEIEPNVFEVNAHVRVDEINEELGIDIPENDLYETVAGFILYKLGHIPNEGERLHWDGLEFQVLQMKGPKIERIKITVEDKHLPKVSTESSQTPGTIPASSAAKEAHVG